MAAISIRPVRLNQGIITALADAGRWLMDVFGFGAVIQKIEDYFGTKVCGFLLIVLALTALIVCANLIVTYGVFPLIDLFAMTGVTATWEFIRSILFAVASGVIASAIVYWVIKWLMMRKLDQIEDKARTIVESANKAANEANEVTDEARRVWNKLVTASRQFEERTGEKILDDDTKP